MKPSTKRRISHFLEYYWAALLALGFISFSCFYYPISAINEYKNYEQINFFIEAGFLKDDTIEDDILKDFKQDNVLDVNFYCYSPKDENLGNLYEKFGKEADILVMSEKDLIDADKYISTAFASLESFNEDFSLGENSSSYNYFSYEEKTYGISIYEKDNDSYNSQFNFDQFIDFVPEDNYYVVFNTKSVNIGSKTTNALKVASYIFNRYQK